MENITGLVLAGGLSQRMKTDKALIKFKGKTLLENQLDLLKPIFNSVLISANTNNYSFTNVEIIKDEQANIGPIGGIRSVLKNVETDYIFAISVDMPMITAELIKYLISQKENYDIVMPIFNGKYEPTCAVYSKKCIKIIDEQILAKDFKLGNLIKKSHTKIVEITKKSSLYKEQLFINLNNPENLNELSRVC